MKEKDIAKYQKIFNPKEFCLYCSDNKEKSNCDTCYYYDQDYSTSNFNEKMQPSEKDKAFLFELAKAYEKGKQQKRL